MYPQTCVRAVFEIKGKVSLLSHVETSDAKKKKSFNFGMGLFSFNLCVYFWFFCRISVNL